MFNKIAKVFFSRPLFWSREIYNRARYGPLAPRPCELLYVPVELIVAIPFEHKEKLGGRLVSAKVAHEWPVSKEDVIPLSDVDKISACLARWRDGLSWEDAGVFDLYGHRDPWARIGLAKRYDRLDEIYGNVSRDRRLKCRSELKSRNFREYDGIRINFGPNGELVFVDGGSHRLAMAIASGLERVPAMPGLVHRNAIKYYQTFRPPKTV